jgi:hypothetical protein
MTRKNTCSSFPVLEAFTKNSKKTNRLWGNGYIYMEESVKYVDSDIVINVLTAERDMEIFYNGLSH